MLELSSTDCKAVSGGQDVVTIVAYDENTLGYMFADISTDQMGQNIFQALQGAVATIEANSMADDLAEALQSLLDNAGSLQDLAGSITPRYLPLPGDTIVGGGSSDADLFREIALGVDQSGAFTAYFDTNNDNLWDKAIGIYNG